MTVKKLKQMLESKAITQEEYDEMLEKLGLSEDDDDDEGNDDGKGKKTDDGKLPENIQALIQSAVDRATNKLGNDNKKLREQLDTLRREKMSDEEIRKLEFEEREKAFAEKEKELKEKEMRIFALKAIKDAGLDDGSDSSVAMSLADILIGDDEDTITSRTTTFKSLVDKVVSAQVQQRFKDNGRDVKRGGSGKESDDDKDKKETSVAVELGKKAAERNKAAQSVLDNYIGGNN